MSPSLTILYPLTQDDSTSEKPKFAHTETINVLFNDLTDLKVFT